MEASSFWNNRYAGQDFIFGTEPNSFLAEKASLIQSGPVLCLGEGEGRNAVHLAALGHAVTAVDLSEVGLTKARQLAATRGLKIETVAADLATYEIEHGKWSGVVSIFLHLPPELRRRLLAEVARGLAPGGVFVLEAYTPAQLAFCTGGPKEPELLVTLSGLRECLDGMEWIVGREIEREVIEGSGHTGRASVVQVVVRAPCNK